jgi:hypothetical protein
MIQPNSVLSSDGFIDDIGRSQQVENLVSLRMLMEQSASEFNDHARSVKTQSSRGLLGICP